MGEHGPQAGLYEEQEPPGQKKQRPDHSNKIQSSSKQLGEWSPTRQS